ncbi:MAG: carbohydrate porin [Phycisphaerales bacterium]
MDSHARGPGFEFLPTTPAKLAPYLSFVNTISDTALQPGALVPSDPVSSAAQWVKTELAKVGLRYVLRQSYTFAAMHGRIAGDPAINAYAFQLVANWSIFDSDDLGGTSGWVSTEVDGGSGLGIDWATQGPRNNIGSFGLLDYNWTGVDLFLGELAWAQSFLGGELVVSAGVLDQTNYFDLNIYSNTAFGQLKNSAFVENPVIPMPGNNLGFNIQWQPADWIYAMFGVGSNNQLPGQSPVRNVSASDLSYLLEIGLVGKDVLGLGAGVYRLQPFAATTGGESGGGFAVNFQQALGKNGPFGAFGRFGVSNGIASGLGLASAAASGGIVMVAPFSPSSDGASKSAGLFAASNNDYAAVGFKWTQAGQSASLVHRDEYALELTYVMQITPTMTLQPDLQFVWDPSYSSKNSAIVFQLSLNVQG